MEKLSNIAMVISGSGSKMIFDYGGFLDSNGDLTGYNGLELYTYHWDDKTLYPKLDDSRIILLDIYIHTYVYTIWLFNIAMENHHF